MVVTARGLAESRDRPKWLIEKFGENHLDCLKNCGVSVDAKTFVLLTRRVAFEISLSLWRLLHNEPLALASGLGAITRPAKARR